MLVEAKIWHTANNPLFLRNWVPRMQVSKLSLSKVPLWIHILHLPVEYWNPTCFKSCSKWRVEFICNAKLQTVLKEY